MSTRRKVVQKSIGMTALAGALPNAWLKPVVNQIVLPTHAQTTQFEECLEPSVEVEGARNTQVPTGTNRLGYLGFYPFYEDRLVDVDKIVGEISVTVSIDQPPSGSSVNVYLTDVLDTTVVLASVSNTSFGSKPIEIYYYVEVSPNNTTAVDQVVFSYVMNVSFNCPDGAIKQKEYTGSLMINIFTS